MKTLFTLFLLCLVSSTGSAQFIITATEGFGPFPQGQTRSNTFTITNIPVGVTVDSVAFQIVAGSGTSARTYATQRSTSLSFTANMGILPWQPEPQLMAVVYQTNQWGARPTSTIVKQITIGPPNVLLTSTNNFGPVIVGRAHSATFTASNLPSGTTSVRLTLTDATGAVIAQRDTAGSNLQSSSLAYTTQKYPGQLQLNALVRYPSEPTGGYLQSVAIADSLIPPIVTASEGFGPFDPFQHLMNTFVVQGLGPGCTSVQWIIQYPTPYGALRTPVDVTRTYDQAKDSMHFVYDMRNISPGSILTVIAKYGQGLALATQRMYTLIMPTSPNPPLFRINDSIPLAYGIARADTIVISRLPARTIWSKLTLIDATGTVITTKEVQSPGAVYQDSAMLTFDVAALEQGTALLRAEFQNDSYDDRIEYDYSIEVRDTSKVFLFADLWGPFVQRDSATITPGVTDLRPVTGPAPTAVFGRFTIVDTNAPETPLQVSPLLDLSNVRSTDSLLYWPDTGYVVGAANYNRAQIQTYDLPLGARVTFERLVVRGTDTTRDAQASHMIRMIPSPGTLTMSPALDSTYIVTRTNPVTFTISDLQQGATVVRFRVSGTADLTPVAQMEIPVQAGLPSVSWSTDLGALPVNAQVFASVVSSTSSDDGTTIVRTLNTMPDTLSMTTSVRLDTIALDWAVDPSTQRISGVTPLTTNLVFSRIPAQTRSISIRSIDDLDRTVDSISVPVPYRLAYDPALTISTAFSFRAHNTRFFEVRYHSDGGPRDGIRYTRPIVVRPANIVLAARKIDATKNPPVALSTPLRQGSSDILDVTARFAPGGVASQRAGLSAGLAIDSVRFDVVDCGDRVVSTGLVRSSASAMTGIVADTVAAVSTWPLAATHVSMRIYSSSLRLPAEGVSVNAPITLIPAPIFTVPLGFRHPTHRVLDTINATLLQQCYMTNVDGIFEVDSLAFVDRNGVVRRLFSSQIPMVDTIRFPAFDLNTLNASGSPFTVRGVLRSQTCDTQQYYVDTLAVVFVDSVFPGPAQKNWINSSLGWGPFHQGKFAQTRVAVKLDPSFFIGARNSSSEVFRIDIRTTSQFGTDSSQTPRTVTFPRNNNPLPASVMAYELINLTGADSTASFQVRVTKTSMGMAGPDSIRVWTYQFPILVLNMPDQPITLNKRDFEQSVLAGQAGQPPVMQDTMFFRIDVASSYVDSMHIDHINATNIVLDSWQLRPTSVDSVAETSVFTYNRDVAQYGWPHIARGQGHVDVKIGYIFNGKTYPTKIQHTSIDIEPHADWLNGTTAVLDGTPTSTTVPFTATIPMPSSAFSVFIPLFNDIIFGIDKDGFGNNLRQIVKAQYDRTTKGFTLREQPQDDNSSWPPTVSVFGGYSPSYKVVVDDGSKSGEFTALYRFVESDSIENRELRIRSLVSSKVTAGKGIIGFIQALANVISEIVGDAEDEETGGVVELKPLFVLSGSAAQISTVNLAAEETGQLQHVGEVLPAGSEDAQNEFPSSEAVSVGITGGGGLELEFFKGLAGLGATVSETITFATGETYSGPVAAPRRQYYAPTANPSWWLTIELSILWGLIKIDLFKGCLYHETMPGTMPSFGVFGEQWESIFKSGRFKVGDEDRVQSIAPIAVLPQETPFYRPAPTLAGSDSVLLGAWVEHSVLDGSSTLVLGELDRASHQFSRTSVVASNRNGIHDPQIVLDGTSGDALIAWTQNDRSAGDVNNSEDYRSVMQTENVHVAVVDAERGGAIAHLVVRDEQDRRIDGKPSIAIARDGTNAMVVWPALSSGSTTTELMGARLFRVNGQWEMGDARALAQTSGLDRDVTIGALDDGTYVIAWVNDPNDNGDPKAMVMTSNGTLWNTPVAIASGDDDLRVSDVDLATSGTRAIVLVARHDVDDSTDTRRDLVSFTYESGSWSQANSVDLRDASGYIRHMDVALRPNGETFVVLDVFDRVSDGDAERSVITLSGASPNAPSSWSLRRDARAIVDRDNTVWSLGLAAGPDGTYYLISQELDTIRGNRQTYGNGLPIGSDRVNVVLRGVRVAENGDIVERRFGGQPVSVDDEGPTAVERDIRFRPYLMDPAPNPAQNFSTVPVIVQIPGSITLTLRDATGRIVRTLHEGSLDSGVQGVTFSTEGLSTGAYFVVMTDTVGTTTSVPLRVIR